jgi:hypothetical protein
MRVACRLIGLALLLLLSPSYLFAQTEQESLSGSEPVRLFMDCMAPGCDRTHLRREIQFVDHVQDIRDSDVYLLVTGQRTGAGGFSSELIFEGRGRFEEMTDTIPYISAFDATTDEIRDGMTRLIKIGLMRYVGLTPQAEDVEISLLPSELKERLGRPGGPPGGPGGPTALPEDDPWDFWVFSVRGSGSVSGESNRSTSRFSGSLSANRVTEEWKFSFGASASYSEARYDYEAIDYSVTNIRRDYSFDGSIVKALAERWSAGLRFGARSSTYYNLDFEGSVSPVLEYSFFPYEDSSRKSLLLDYTLDWTYADYVELTIFEKMEESYLTQNLSLSLAFTQPWGTAFSIFSAGSHLDDFDKHHATVFGGVNIRLKRGLSLNLSASYSRVQDRISVALGAVETPEDVLLRRKQFQIDYTYRTSIGLTYRFGSVFNNIVNPRLGGGGMMGGIPMIIF